MSVTVKEDTSKHNLQTYLAFSLVYHYENLRGILEAISINMANSYGMTTFIDYAINDTERENISLPGRFTNVYEFPDSLIGKDSVKIFRRLSGSFFTNDSDNSVEFVGNFSWNDSLDLHVQR